MKKDYRTRCYNAFVTTKWSHSHGDSEKSYTFYTKIMKKRMNKFLPFSKTSRILDLACGAGHFLYYLQHNGYEQTQGIDLSDEMLTLAKKRGVHGCDKADMFSYLPQHKEEFDFIIANDIVEHLTKDETMELLDLIHGSLIPGGKVLISTINAMSLFGFGTLHNEYTHITGYTPMSLAQILRVCGFSRLMIRGEAPVEHDLKSAIRGFLWKFFTSLFRLFITVERGTGRGMWKRKVLFEPRFFALAHKPEKSYQGGE